MIKKEKETIRYKRKKGRKKERTCEWKRGLQVWNNWKRIKNEKSAKTKNKHTNIKKAWMNYNKNTSFISIERQIFKIHYREDGKKCNMVINKTHRWSVVNKLVS